MCTHVTETGPATGAGKGAPAWFPLSALTVYYDHPVSAQDEHTLNIDFAAPGRGPGARVAVELTTGTAVELVRAVAKVLSDVPADLTGLRPGAARALLDVAQALSS
jgi:hypothetical protein